MTGCESPPLREFQDGIGTTEVGVYPFSEECKCGATWSGTADTAGRRDKTVAAFWVLHWKPECARVIRVETTQ